MAIQNMAIQMFKAISARKLRAENPHPQSARKVGHPPPGSISEARKTIKDKII